MAYDADTTYTAALVAAARARLSARAARDADSLLTLATLRRDAGDASDLEVELATVSAGQLANAAAGDSLEAANAVIAVQALMGLPTVSASIALGGHPGSPASHSAPGRRHQPPDRGRRIRCPGRRARCFRRAPLALHPARARHRIRDR